VTENHEHDIVWVTSPDTTQARQYCRSCGYRGEWQELPPELQVKPEDELVDIRRQGGSFDGPSVLAEQLDRGN
jgi:hypothetical protein